MANNRIRWIGVGCFFVLLVPIASSLTRRSVGPEEIAGKGVPAEASGLDVSGHVKLSDPATSPAIVRHLVEGNPVRIERGGAKILEIEPLAGKLSPENKKLLADRYQEYSAILQNRLSEVNQQLDPAGQVSVRVFEEDADVRVTLAKYEAIRKAIYEDDYIILPQGAAFSLDVFPDGSVVTDNAVTHDGVAANVVFVLPRGSHPHVDAAAEALQQVRGARLSEDAFAFNGKTYEERKLAYEESRLALQALKDGPGSGVDRDAMARWKKDVVSKLLPRGLVVDPQTYLATVRSRRAQ